MTPISAAASAAPYQTSSSAQAGSQLGAASSRPQQLPTEAASRKQMNVQILQSSMEVSLRSGNDAQALLLRSAIEGINSALEPVMGPDAIQNAMNQDNSAEATAERIVSLSTAFFEAYAARRKNDDPETVVKDFAEIIRGGFEKGFNEAKDILSGLGVFSGQLESDVMKTRELVLQGYDRFVLERLPTSDQ
jgi:hypothetical protein